MAGAPGGTLATPPSEFTSAQPGLHHDVCLFTFKIGLKNVCECFQRLQIQTSFFVASYFRAYILSVAVLEKSFRLCVPGSAQQSECALWI